MGEEGRGVGEKDAGLGGGKRNGVGKRGRKGRAVISNNNLFNGQ